VADEALLRRHAELVKEAEALRASLSAREDHIKSLEAEAARAKEAAEVSSALLEEERNKQVALREDHKVLGEELGKVTTGCLAEVLELQRTLRNVLTGAGAHFTPVEGVSSAEGIMSLLRYVNGGVGRLPEVLDSVGDFAAYTGVAGVVSLLERESCPHVRRLGSKDYEVDREIVRHPSKVGRTVGRIMTEDLWVKVGRGMLRATTPNPDAEPSSSSVAAEGRGTETLVPEVSSSAVAVAGANTSAAPLVGALVTEGLNTVAEATLEPEPEAVTAEVLIAKVSVR
jgi:hypothetical protein